MSRECGNIIKMFYGVDSYIQGVCAWRVMVTLLTGPCGNTVLVILSEYNRNLLIVSSRAWEVLVTLPWMHFNAGILKLHQPIWSQE